MPLIMPYEKMWDMPLGGTSDEKQIPHLAGNVYYVVLGGLAKILWRYKVIGRDKLREFNGKCGVMLVGNHTSYLDVAFNFFAARPQQWVRLMARDSLFTVGNGVVGHIFSRAGAFPVKRDEADRTSIKRAVRMLRNNELVCVLPEGTRRGKGSRKPTLHAGAAFIAKMANVPIIPMAIINAENIKRKGEPLRFPKVELRYGDPLLIKDFEFLPKADRLDGMTWYAMREVFSMVQGKPASEVDMRELFPDDRDFSEVFESHRIPRYTAREAIEMLRPDAYARG